MPKYYSQNDEEKHILEWFNGKVGRFLDIGAYSRYTFSNTGRLSELGWGGVCVEPNPPHFAALEKEYAGVDGVQIVNVALGVKSGIAKFYSNPDAVSTLDSKHMEKWQDDVAPFHAIDVMVMTWHDFLPGFPPPYDFVNIDVEGTNWQLLNAVNIDTLGASLFCVEFDDSINKMIARFFKHGYKVVHKTSENLLMGRR